MSARPIALLRILEAKQFQSQAAHELVKSLEKEILKLSQDTQSLYASYLRYSEELRAALEEDREEKRNAPEVRQ